MGAVYREYRPRGLLDVVDCVWTSTRRGVQRVVPDGCMDIIWTGQGLIVAGPDTAAHLAESDRDIVGVRFRPGMAPGFLGIPADAIRDTRVDLSDVWARARVRKLTEHLDAGQPGQILLDAVTPAQPDGFAEQVHRLARRSGDIRAMADKLGVSERHLHRLCLAKFGYGPKTLHRVLRFTQAMDLAYAGTTFADVAHRTGYADQAHLSREVKSLAGTTLGHLVKGALVRTPT